MALTSVELLGCWCRSATGIGMALRCLATGVFVLAPTYLNLIVPFVGGGALILGVLWMRRP